MNKNHLLLIILILFSFPLFSQEETDSVEVYLIDSFVTPEKPNKFILSFFTSAPTKSRVVIDGKYEYKIAEELSGEHKFQLDISELQFEKEIVPYIIYVVDSSGNNSTSERYEFNLPYERTVESESNFLMLCLFGGAVFALPSPVYVKAKTESYFSLTKEIPIVTIRGKGIKYPMGYFSAEYSYVFNAPVNNFLRLGYKHIIDFPGLEYIAPGINGFTNFKGFNGISPELSVGLMKIYNTFTIYTRYRFNVKPGEKGSEFHEFSIGLYTNFFSVYL
jgi:hypothetical protein